MSDGAEPPRAEEVTLGDLLGARVISDGARVGRLHDLAVRLEDGAWPVVAVRIRSRSGVVDVPWRAVRDLAPGRAEISFTEPAFEAGRDDVPWLAHAVLDHELIDLDGKRVIRIGDVLLERTGDGLAAVGVEIGIAAVVRRLGLRRLAGRLRRDLVPLSAVHLPSTSRDPMTVATTRARLGSLKAHQLAGLLDALPPTVAGAMLETLEPAHRERTGHHLARRHAMRRLRRRLTNFRAP
jgi:sporulation protein YlmC with PRC-barrel domain